MICLQTGEPRSEVESQEPNAVHPVSLYPHTVEGQSERAEPIPGYAAAASRLPPPPHQQRPRGRPPKDYLWESLSGRYVKIPPEARCIAKKRKKIRDPNKPRRAMSSYLFYIKDMQGWLNTEHPNMEYRDAQVLLSNMWKEADVNTRMQYERMAEKAREQYRAEMKSYTNFCCFFMYVPVAIVEQDAPKKTKDPNRPKRAMSSFLLYCKDERERIKTENPRCNMADVQKIAAEEWRNVSVERKQMYNSQSEALRIEYRDKMKEYDVPNDTVCNNTSRLTPPDRRRDTDNQRQDVQPVPNIDPTSFSAQMLPFGAIQLSQQLLVQQQFAQQQYEHHRRFFSPTYNQ